MRKKYRLNPGGKIKFEVTEDSIRIIPLATPEEVNSNIGFLGVTSQRPGKKEKLLKALMEEKRLEKEF